MIAVEMRVSTDTATPRVRALIMGLRPEQAGPVIGRAARNAIRNHLFAYDSSHANRLGGARTNYYGGAARATQFRVEGERVIISINQVGFALRYFGGTIKPVTKKFLTIPARVEAYGKRASEFPDLIVLWNDKGPYALARAASTALRRPRGSTRAVGAGTQGGEVMFWLVKEAHQTGDKGVLPSNEELSQQITRELSAYAKRLWERANGPLPSGGGES